MEKKALGLKLLSLRQARGLTQKQLCDDLNIGRSTYSYFETGSRVPDLETLLLFAQYYQVSLDELVIPSDAAPCQTKETSGSNSASIQLVHHLMSRHIPVDFIFELSKADYDFLKDYKELTDDNKAELQYLMNYKLRKQVK